ncbi:MAG TPA: hypothetical protein P5136_01580 [Methanofastidiosum sp.]|nr:hypothetical protein [Methanofastidiosum sp.]
MTKAERMERADYEIRLKGINTIVKRLIKNLSKKGTNADGKIKGIVAVLNLVLELSK